jgi:hypothetical protein
MLECQFPQCQFTRKYPFEIVSKHYEMISLSWGYTQNQWESQVPFENSIDWEYVQTRLKSLDFVVLYGMNPYNQREAIRKNLVEVERERKEGQE